MPQAYATAPPPPSATSELTRMVSLPLPQELIEMIIDKLVDHELPSGPLAGISNYSTVSRQWVAGTQKHHFNSIYFESQADQDKWRTTINPDPSGVSRYVRMLSWFRVDTLEGFDRHIRAFTHVETAVLDVCGFIHSPSVVESFASMGSSLVELDIIGGSTTSGIIASLLAALPCLRQFRSLYLRIREDDDVIEYPLVIPFFEDPNSLDLQLDGYLRPSLSWVPPSARFRDLRINMPCILDESGCVNQWITSSAGTLESLSIVEHSERACPLSLCTIFDQPLTAWFPFRSSWFYPTRPLGVHRAAGLRTHTSTPSSCRYRSSLPLLFPTPQDRSASGGNPVPVV